MRSNFYLNGDVKQHFEGKRRVIFHKTERETKLLAITPSFRKVGCCSETIEISYSRHHTYVICHRGELYRYSMRGVTAVRDRIGNLTRLIHTLLYVMTIPYIHT